MRTLILGAMFCGGLLANDVVFLNGKVTVAGGAAPGKSVEIQLSCPGADPVRGANSNKKGNYYLKVERDEFNHVARALPATATDVNSGELAGSCAVVGNLKGYSSSKIDLGKFTIGKDLKLPDLVLTPKKP